MATHLALSGPLGEVEQGVRSRGEEDPFLWGTHFRAGRRLWCTLMEEEILAQVDPGLLEAPGNLEAWGKGR